MFANEALDGRWENVVFLRVRTVDEDSPGLSRGASRQACEFGTLNSRLCIATTSGYLEPLEIKPSSGRHMTWRDYVNGRHVAPGDRFIAIAEENADR